MPATCQGGCLAGVAVDFIVIKLDHDKNFKRSRTLWLGEWIEFDFNLVRGSPLMVAGQEMQHHPCADEGHHLNSFSIILDRDALKPQLITEIYI